MTDEEVKNLYGYKSKSDMDFFHEMRNKIREGNAPKVNMWSAGKRSTDILGLKVMSPGGIFEKTHHGSANVDLGSHGYDKDKMLQGNLGDVQNFINKMQGMRRQNLEKTYLHNENITDPRIYEDLKDQSRIIEDYQRMHSILSDLEGHKKKEEEDLGKRDAARLEKSAMRRRLEKKGLDKEKTAGHISNIKKLDKVEKLP